MRVTQPSDGHSYCSECDAGHSFRVRFTNPRVVQNDGFALCAKHAEQLASQLLQRVRKLANDDDRRARSTSTGNTTNG